MVDKFLENVREIKPSARITFDKSGLDSTADINTNWFEEDTTSTAFGRRRQLLSMDIKPKYKYATLDGKTKLDGSAHLFSDKVETIFPLWSRRKCKENGVFEEVPEYELNFFEPQHLYDMYIKGEEEWEQYMVEYELIFEFEANAKIKNVNFYKPPIMTLELVEKEPLKLEEYVNVNDKITSITSDATTNALSMKIANVNADTTEIPVGQWVDLTELARMSQQAQDMFAENRVTKVTLKIYKWSEGNTTSKIMYFSSSRYLDFTNSEIASLNVLEEKGESVDKLSYGITSNSVSVKVKNINNKFIKERERLRKNRLIEPTLSANGSEEYKLGKFYSDSWEITADSGFVTCKGYDLLYNLQGLNIYYPMQKIDNVYKINSNVTEREVFETIFAEVNRTRNNCGIYGEEIEYELKGDFSGTMDYVLLSYDTAWNMLKSMANYTRSYIYVDRSGKVIVEKDGYEESLSNSSDNEDNESIENTLITIDSGNAFTYNLPNLCKTIVNKAIVKYKDIKPNDNGEAGTEKLITETITVEDFVVKNGVAICKVGLKNFATEIACEKIIIDGDYIYEINDTACKDINIKVYDVADDVDKIEIEITYTGFELEDKEYVAEDALSQTVNGVVEYTNDSGLIFKSTKAKQLADGIITDYKNGKSYIETKWIGTPNLKLSDTFNSSGKYMQQQKYQCMSNEFSIDGGLRVKTKAIQV